MKKILAILLALSLICCLFAGCGEGTTDTSSSNTSSGNISSEATSSDETSSTDTSSESASSGSLVRPGADSSVQGGEIHVHNYLETVVAPTCKAKGYTFHSCVCGDEYKSDETPVSEEHNMVNGVCKDCGKTTAVNPSAVKQTTYFAPIREVPGGLKTPELLFEGEYIVLGVYEHSEVKEFEDSEPFEFNGKTYYGVGAGQSPYLLELTSTEIIAKSMNDNSVVLKAVLLADGTIKVTYSTDSDFVVGDIFTAKD